MPCRFIGHTMADAIPLKPNRTEACQTLGIDEKGRYLAILWGAVVVKSGFLLNHF